MPLVSTKFEVRPPPWAYSSNVRLSDRLRWYCQSGNHKEPTVIRELAFHCTDLGTQLKPIIQVQYVPSRTQHRI